MEEKNFNKFWGSTVTDLVMDLLSSRLFLYILRLCDGVESKYIIEISKISQIEYLCDIGDKWEYIELTEIEYFEENNAKKIKFNFWDLTSLTVYFDLISIRKL